MTSLIPYVLAWWIMMETRRCSVRHSQNRQNHCYRAEKTLQSLLAFVIRCERTTQEPSQNLLALLEDFRGQWRVVYCAFLYFVL